MGCLPVIMLIISTLFLGISETVTEPPQAVASPPQMIENQYAGIPRDRTEDGAFILGFEEAPVTLVVFEDFLCPHCGMPMVQVDNAFQVEEIDSYINRLESLPFSC